MKRANAVLRSLLPDGVPLGKVKKACNEESLDILLEALVADRKVKVERDEETGEQLGEAEPVFDLKRAAYEVKVIRMYASALGVRPAPQKLKEHRDIAMRQHNYKLLERILALSEENPDSKALAVDMALDALKRFGPEDRRYKKVKETFGEITFTPQQVTELYLDHIKESRRQGYVDIGAEHLNAISNETGVPLSPEVVEQAYLTLLASESDPRTILNFHEVTGMTMPLTAPIIDELEKLAQAQPDKLGRLDGSLHFCKDKKVAQRLQRAALGAGHLDHALSIAEEAGIPLDEAVMRARYRTMVQHDDAVGAVHLFEKTNVPFGTTLLHAVYANLYSVGNFRMLLALQKKVGVQPHFKTDAPHIVMRPGELNEQEALAALEVIDGARLPVAARANAIGEVYALVDPGSVLTIDERVDKLCEQRNLNLPDPVRRARATRIVAGALVRIDKAETDYRPEDSPHLSPLEPYKRCNVGKYQEYGRNVRDIVRDTVKRITALEALPEAAQVESLYRRCVDLALVQCARGDDCLGFADMQKAMGLPVQDATFFDALRAYALRGTFDGVLQPQLIERFKDKTGLHFPLTIQDRSTIGRAVVEKWAGYQTDQCSMDGLPEWLHWLAALDGEKGFNDAFQQDVGNLAERLLTERRMEYDQEAHAFDALAPFAGTYLWTQARVERVRETVLAAVKDGRFAEFRQKQRRVPFELVGREELTELAEDLLYDGLGTGEYRDYSRYDLLVSELPFVAVDFNAVRNTVIEYLHEEPKNYSRVVDVERRLGRPIIATEEECDSLLERVFDLDEYTLNPRAFLSALGADFQKHKGRIVQNYVRRLFTTLKPWHLRELKLLYQDWGVDLATSESQIADKLLEDTLHDEATARELDVTPEARTLRGIGQIIEVTADGKTRYCPPRTLVDALFAKYHARRSYASMSTLIGLTGQAPARAMQDEMVDAHIALSYDIAADPATKVPDERWERGTLVGGLTHRHNYVLAPAQATRLYDALLTSESETALQYLSRMSSRLDDYRRVFNLPNAMDPQRQARLHEKVRLCALKEPVATFNKHTLMLYELTSASTAGSLLTDDAIRAEAAKTSAAYLAGEMPEKESFFRGFAYALLTGVTPALSAEQMVRCKQQLAVATGYLRKSDQPYVEKKIAQWCGG